MEHKLSDFETNSFLSNFEKIQKAIDFEIFQLFDKISKSNFWYKLWCFEIMLLSTIQKWKNFLDIPRRYGIIDDHLSPVYQP